MEAKIPDQTELVDQIIDVIVSEGMIERDKIQLDATIESLGLKSIDIVMILTALEEKFDVYIPMDGPFHDAKDVKSLIDAIAAYIIKEKSGGEKAGQSASQGTSHEASPAMSVPPRPASQETK